MQDVEFVNGLLDFITRSPTPFHAVQVMAELLDENGFKRLDEKAQWGLQEKTSCR